MAVVVPGPLLRQLLVQEILGVILLSKDLQVHQPELMEVTRRVRPVVAVVALAQLVVHQHFYQESTGMLEVVALEFNHQ